MKFCEKHWADLRAAIAVRGLDGLVSKDGEQAVVRTLADLAGGAKHGDFDPLMTATLMVYGKAVEHMPYLLFGPEPERGLPDCPVCEALRRHPDPCPHGCTRETYERWWIDGPADAALEEARRRGLMLPEVAP